MPLPIQSNQVYGGTIRAGKAAGESLDIVSAFQAYGEYAYDRITEVFGSLLQNNEPKKVR